MGHLRLGVLPQTRKWLHVVEMLHAGAGLADIAAAVADAAEISLQNASADPASYMPSGC